jgi:PRC-barrel domain protein
MKKTMLLASAAMIGVGFLAAYANAQGVPQTVDIAKVDVQKVAAGYRASKVIGSSVLNEANETIGKVDDLLVTCDGKEPYARSVDRWLPGHGHSHGGRPLRQPQVR